MLYQTVDCHVRGPMLQHHAIQLADSVHRSKSFLVLMSSWDGLSVYTVVDFVFAQIPCLLK